MSEAFGTRLKALRLQAAQKQEDVASAARVNVGTVSRWERGKGNPRHDQLLALAKHFSVPLDQLGSGVVTEHAVELPDFAEFLQTEYGRIAQERGYVRALLTMAYPFPPDVQVYAKVVSALMLADEERKAARTRK